MLGNFINAIPDSLPYEVRKKSVISIVASSNTDLKKLVGDGEKRLDALNKFSRDYHNSTVKAVEDYKDKIEELRNQISIYEEQIKINETLLKEQNNTIKYETDKVESIINFIK
jgi:DNA repair ATPase RecN